MTLTKNSLVQAFRARFSESDAKNLLEMLLETLKSHLEKGEDVKIAGFGKWKVKQKGTRKGRNPHTGELAEISARKVVTFHASAKLLSAVRKAG